MNNLNKKQKGQFFTPIFIVEEILKQANFEGEKILNSKILEPSAGDGAFLIKIYEKIIIQAKINNYSNKLIKKILINNVKALEIDKVVYQKLISNIINYLSSQNINIKEIELKNSIINTNTLTYKFNEKFDFILGNPPYVRIQNLNKENLNLIRNMEFTKKGNCDIYYSFFEIAIKNLKKEGKIAFITSNSFFKNISAFELRKYLIKNKMVEKILDFESNKVFPGISIYTAIIILSFDNKNSFEYSRCYCDKENQIKKIEIINNKYENFKSGKKWIFLNKSEVEFNEEKKIKVKFNISNGLATLSDFVFITDDYEFIDQKCIFNGEIIEKAIVKKIYKISTEFGNKKKDKVAIFPYKKVNNKWILIDETNMKKDFPLAFKYLSKYKDQLLKRSLDKHLNKETEWYAYGRHQAINYFDKEKIIIQSIIKDKINFRKIEKNTLVYSGLFLVDKQNVDLNNTDEEKFSKLFNDKKFLKYIWYNGSDKSGGYKTISTQTIKEYIYE